MGKRIATFAGAVLAASSLFVATAAATPSSSTVIVTQSDLASNISDVVAHPQKWFFYNDESDSIDNSLGSMAYGPGTPPGGQGSAQISVTGSQRRNLATYQFSGTKLADITTLKFSTFNPSAGNGGSSNRSGYLNFNVDFNGTDTWQKRLVYLPSDNGAIAQDTWQTWDAVNNGNALYRYSGATWPGGSVSGDTPRTLNDLIASYPGIRIRVTDSWLGVRVGEPYPDGYTENIDNVVFGTAAKTVTYDFEPTNQPDRAKDCKNNGWKAFNAPVFASQKACEKWVEASVHGTFRMANPNQKIRLDVSNTTRDNHDWDRHDRGHDDHRKRQNTVEYWNFDYTDVNGQDLHYKTSALCQNINPVTNSARVLFQIPAGHGGLSGLYIVIEVKDGAKNSPATYAQAVAPDLATGTQWCETGVGFSPSYYTVTKDRLEIE